MPPLPWWTSVESRGKLLLMLPPSGLLLAGWDLLVGVCAGEGGSGLLLRVAAVQPLDTAAAILPSSRRAVMNASRSDSTDTHRHTHRQTARSITTHIPRKERVHLSPLVSM